jgi:cysteine desulfurase
MYANNEIGTIQPIKGVSALCKKYKALLHVDACQASPYLELDVKRLGIDMLTLNGSKMYGPKGVGLLYVRKGILLSPVAYGGGQEQGLRSGTENVPGIVGLAEALKLSQTERKRESKREMTLRESLIEELTSIKDVILNGDAKLRLPNNACLSFLGIEGESLMLELDKAGVCVSTGSACSSRSLEPSHVIMAIHKHDKLPQKYAHSSIRFTIGRFTTKEEIEYAVSATKDAVNKLRGLSSIW